MREYKAKHNKGTLLEGSRSLDKVSSDTNDRIYTKHIDNSKIQSKLQSVNDLISTFTILFPKDQLHMQLL